MFDYSLLHYPKEHYELRLKSAEPGVEHALLKDVPDWVDPGRSYGWKRRWSIRPAPPAAREAVEIGRA